MPLRHGTHHMQQAPSRAEGSPHTCLLARAMSQKQKAHSFPSLAQAQVIPLLLFSRQGLSVFVSLSGLILCCNQPFQWPPALLELSAP